MFYHRKSAAFRRQPELATSCVAIALACSFYGCRLRSDPAESAELNDGPAAGAQAPIRSTAVSAPEDSGARTPEPESPPRAGNAPPVAAASGAAGGSAALSASNNANTSHAAAGGTSAAAPAAAGAANDDAGVAEPRDAGSVGPGAAKLETCSADLAQCIIAAPLNYDGCLRMNADNGCPDPDAGAAMNPMPILDENGKPLSAVCQAELAKCIMKNPTPENAQRCTDIARRCT